ncbi:DUF4350 domain-containing protein [bacterium]|nr:DUF4350 domain-containing protein [bacterium]
MIKVLYDNFFHLPPGHRLSRNIAVGGYVMNFGRYSPEDFYHPNGLSVLCAELLGEYDLRPLRQPYSEVSLADADILFIANPDYPPYQGASPYRWGPDDVDAILGFADRGGGVLLLVNSFLSRPDFWEENFDLERVSLLFDRLGLKWDPNFMSDADNILPAVSGRFTVGYGQGGRVLAGKLPPTAKPVLTWDGNIFGFEMPVGKGRLIVLGDAGLISNGLYCFPGFDNGAFIQDVFHRLRPAWTTAGIRQHRHLAYGHLSCATSPNGITDALFRALRPAARYQIDHHYRHLLWESTLETGPLAKLEQQCPVPVAGLSSLADRARTQLQLRHVNLDTDAPGAEFALDAAVRAVRAGDETELTIAGNVVEDQFRWGDIAADTGPFDRLAEPTRLGTVFRLQACLRADGSLKSAVWNQGERIYGRNTRNPHYGYEVLLSSRNGVLMPEA